MILCVFSCEKTPEVNPLEENVSFDFIPTIGLTQVDSFSIELDSMTDYFVQSIQEYTSENGDDFLCFQNYAKRTIYIYNLNSKKLARKITFDASGPNGVGLEISGFKIKSLDSIFILDNRKHSVYLFNDKKEFIDGYLFLEDGKIDGIRPTMMGFPQNNAPMSTGSDVLIPGFPDNFLSYKKNMISPLLISFKY